MSFTNLPLPKIYSFLKIGDRIELALCSKAIFHCVKDSLNAEFDKEICYLFCRSKLMHQKKSKKASNLPVIEIKNQKYSVFEGQIFSIPSILKSISYTFECNEDGLSYFTNKFGDKMIVHSSLLETIEMPEENYECLTNADDLNSGIDFSNPAMLLKRQKMLLEKINKTKQENIENRKKETLKNIRDWGEVAIILCHGGNFNIAGFMRNGKIIETHSDHKYVTRKKQGGRQQGADKRKTGIHSMGASIRRENEKKHSENIENFIEESATMLDRAHLIFLHAPGNNYFVFVGQGACLEKWKEKIRPIGISTTKAKFQETERVFKEISSIKILFKID